MSVFYTVISCVSCEKDNTRSSIQPKSTHHSSLKKIGRRPRRAGKGGGRID